MAKKVIKLWYDPKADLLDVLLEPGVGGVTYDTEDERVEVTVDEKGRLLSFHVMGLRFTEGEPFEVELKPRAGERRAV